MTTNNPVYNERSWAIDIISEINAYCNIHKKIIARAGGEHTLGGGQRKLFPDVLLFGDKDSAVVLQGWELKMPDTEITDSALLLNAEEKANRLHLNSFLVWNVKEAVLYCRNQDNKFDIVKSWHVSGINTRQEVYTQQNEWKQLLYAILDDINYFFENREIVGITLDVAINENLFVDFLQIYVPGIAAKIEQACVKDSELDAELSMWWLDNSVEHPNSTKFVGIARVNLVNWINRFLFAHYLRRFNSTADKVLNIVNDVDISSAISIFEQITAVCDFMNIFQPAIGQEYMGKTAWSGLVELNMFLINLKLESISQETLQQVIDNSLAYSRKKLAGQFSTPRPLADLLVRISIMDRSKPVIDPCCGTGTIARAAYELKRSVGLSISEALSTTWASDKFAFPLQLSSIALSDPQGMGEIIRVFKHDAMNLSIGENVSFIHPQSGNELKITIPEMHSVISNLPFVRFEEIERLNPNITAINEELTAKCCEGNRLSGRADLFAYLILKLSDLVEENGRLGVITSNSWLGSEWGREFRNCLLRCFKVNKIIVSGEGRWFQQPKVVTTLLILQKKSDGQTNTEEQIEFCTTTKRIDEWESEPNGVQNLANGLIARNSKEAGFRKYRYSIAKIEQLSTLGIEWNAFFTDLSWMSDISHLLILANTFFDIARGERRGWDPLFYPKPGHGIEPEYIKPVLKSSADLRGLIATADQEAFCCSDSVDELQKQKKIGALSWIKKFEHATNERNNPLPEVLKRKGMHWYQMGTNTMADMVITMNPGKRLVFHKFENRSFVNQRLIRFTTKIVQEDIDICHALMNSVIGLFLIEASGFGRGLSALDLNATKMRENFHMIDYRKLSVKERNDILAVFSPLLQRDVYDLPEELNNSDRIKFDDAVLKALGFSQLRESIYASLLHLFHIRQTAAEE